MFERELAHLAIDPGAVDRDRRSQSHRPLWHHQDRADARTMMASRANQCVVTNPCGRPFAERYWRIEAG
jgi:hypothetical protein